MKVLHIVGGDLTKGAFLGAYWLHKGMLEVGVESKILGPIPEHQVSENVASISGKSIGRLVDWWFRRIEKLMLGLYQQRETDIFSTGFFGRNILRHPFFVEADIVNIHWVPNGVISLRKISKIRKPVVLTLRDMWLFTGGCHYSMDCEKYTGGCGECPQLASSRNIDLSRAVSSIKSRYLNNSGANLEVVGISDWISSCASASSVFLGKRIHTIPNCVDADIFYPLDKSAARQAIGVPLHAKVVLVGASDVNVFYKGWSQFLDSLPYLNDKSIIIITFGQVNEAKIETQGLEFRHLGYLRDSMSLRLAYSAADVFVAPSVQEAFGKTLVESMLCGTPVVCFDSTGPAGLVNHLQTGYKATPFDSKDLARGIEWVLSTERSGEVRRACNPHAVDRFAKEVIAKKYVKLYEQMIE